MYRRAIKDPAGEEAVALFVQFPLREDTARPDEGDYHDFHDSDGRFDLPHAMTMGETSILHLKAELGDTESVKELLDAGYDIERRVGDDGRTALHAAAFEGAVEVTKLLVSYNADLESMIHGSCRATPLYIAAQEGHIDLVKALIELGANVNFREPQSLATSLHVAVHEDRSPKITKLLCEAGADVNATTTEKHATPLYIATTMNNFSMCRVLLKHGADPGTLDDKYSPYTHASKNRGHNKILCMFEDGGRPTVSLR